MKNGHGIYKWTTGDLYIGSFVREKRQGLGQYVWAEGGEYRGEWKAERMHGFGRLIKDGLDIIGEFSADNFLRPVDNNELTDPRLFNFVRRD